MSVSVERQEKTEVFPKVPKRVHNGVNGKVCFDVLRWDPVCQFAATVELSHERFRVHQPGIGEIVRRVKLSGWSFWGGFCGKAASSGSKRAALRSRAAFVFMAGVRVKS